jgi:hypothetical protein
MVLGIDSLRFLNIYNHVRLTSNLDGRMQPGLFYCIKENKNER